MSRAPLLTIIVTRPGEAGETLCQLLKANDYHAIHFSTIDFIAVSAPDPGSLEKYDFVIFTSPRAVVMSHTQHRIANFSNEIMAVGEGTKAALQQLGYNHIIAPSLNQEGSEALLNVPELQQLKGKYGLIVRGKDGRELLAEKLKARGARIKYLEVYKRILPIHCDSTQVRALMKKRVIHAIVAASCTSVKNLLVALPNENVKKVPLIVTSVRIKEFAKQLGFTRLYRAENASHAAILKAVQQLRGTKYVRCINSCQ